mgnify:FL=1
MNSFYFFISDSKARVPFTILGVMLLLGSSMVSVVFSDLEKDQALTLVETMQSDVLTSLLYDAEADVNRVVNTLGKQALYEIGKNPVVEPIVAETAEQVNKMRLKKRIVRGLNSYLITNFYDDNYNNGRFAINVIISQDNIFPLTSIENITITSVPMQLRRNIHLPFLGPREKQVFPTYWNVSFTLPIEIKSLFPSSTFESVNETLHISTVITVRYPLLTQLIKEYNETINGIGPLWTTSSLISNIYSLARGYKHYQSGKPLNVVDNKHLSPIINAGLLLEEALVFGSIDPTFLIEFIGNVQKSLRNKEPSSAVDSCNSLMGSGFSLNVSLFSESNDAVSQGNPMIKEKPVVNVSAIAEKPLYFFQSVTFMFTNDKGHSVSITLQNPTSHDIQNCIDEYLADGFVLTDTMYNQQLKNVTTQRYIDDFLKSLYSATFSTVVRRDTNPSIVSGDHEGYSIDNGSSSWIIEKKMLDRTVGKPDKGSVKPGCFVYTEFYDIIWHRDHTWSRKEIIETENETKVVWESITVTDTKYEDDVRIAIKVEYYGNNNSVCDIFYRNVSEMDPNLENTIESYKKTVFQPAVPWLLRQSSGVYHQDTIIGDIPNWVRIEIWNELHRISEDISDIKLSDHISVSSFPNPVELLTVAQEDILKKYEANKSVFHQKQKYLNAWCFKSMGWNAVSSVTHWYIEKIDSDIEQIFSVLLSTVETNLDSTVSNVDGVSGADVKKALSTDSLHSLGDMITIPFGYDFNLFSVNHDNYSFHEPLRLAIRHVPGYLDPFEKQPYNGSDQFYIRIENICTLGSTGVPLLPPSPTTPWLITFNIWIVRINGHFAEFEVIDCNQESVFHPLMGHVPLVYCRKDAPVYDIDGNLLGYNKPISFSLDFVACSLVPSWGMMVGDVEGGLIEQDGKP